MPAVAEEALAALEIDEMGLDTTDRKLMAAIAQKFGSGPVGVAAIAALLAEEVETIEDVYEPYLLRLGFMDRTPQGRILTEGGRAHLRRHGYEVPPPRRPDVDMPALWDGATLGDRPSGSRDRAGGLRMSPAASPAAVHDPRPAAGRRLDPRPARPAGAAPTASSRRPSSCRSARTPPSRRSIPTTCVEVGATIILANTYHLYLRPGHERIERLGGLHRFMAWDRPILTDSGGFQVVSLSDLRSVDDDGVTFRSHLDGSVHRFTPEHSIAVQQALGADIAVAFDQPVPPGASSREVVADATARTHRWAERSLRAHDRPDQAIFGIVQGGLEPDLRAGVDRVHREPAVRRNLLRRPGRRRDRRTARRPSSTSRVPLLDGDPRVRYLMGLGSPADLLEAVHRGVDLFDSVLPGPGRPDRPGWVPGGRLNLRNQRFLDDPGPDPGGLSVPRLPDVLAGLHRPSLPGQGAPCLPPGDLSQPDLHPRLHGQDPGRTGRRHLPVESPRSSRARRSDERR